MFINTSFELLLKSSGHMHASSIVNTEHYHVGHYVN